MFSDIYCSNKKFQSDVQILYQLDWFKHWRITRKREKRLVEEGYSRKVVEEILEDRIMLSIIDFLARPIFQFDLCVKGREEL